MPHPYSNKDAEYWLKLTNESEFQSNIFYKKSLIGGIGFKQVKLNSYELGYWIAYEKWGNGYATEAVNGALSYLEKDRRRSKLSNRSLESIELKSDDTQSTGFEHLVPGLSDISDRRSRRMKASQENPEDEEAVEAMMQLSEDETINWEED